VAVDDVLVAVFLRRRGHARGVAAGLGFGHRERADLLAGRQPAEPVVFLPLVTELGDGVADQAARARDGAGQQLPGASQFLDGDGKGAVVLPGATVLLGVGDAVEAGVADGFDDLAGEFAVALVLLDVRFDLGLAERPDRLALLAMAVLEREVCHHGFRASSPPPRMRPP
jgi:hypothetical protein